MFLHVLLSAEMLKPTVADPHPNLVPPNNRYPAPARRAISVRTSAASLTPQHLLAGSQQEHKQAGGTLSATTELCIFFSPILCLSCRARPGKAGSLLINSPLRATLVSRVLQLKGLLV